MFSVGKNEIKIRENLLYYAPYSSGTKEDFYDITFADSNVYPISKTEDFYPLITYLYQQDTTESTIKYDRFTIWNFFTAFGGFLSFTTRFAGYFLSYFSSFSVKNSMIKKLYSVRATEPDNSGNES